MGKYFYSFLLGISFLFLFLTPTTFASVLFADPVSGTTGSQWNNPGWDYHSLYGTYDANGAHGQYYPWRDMHTQDQIIKWTYHYGNAQDILSPRCRISYDGLNTEQVTIYPNSTPTIDEGVNGSYVNKANFSATTTGTVNGELDCIGDTLTYKENGVVKATYTMNPDNTATGVAFYSSGDGDTSISDISICDATGCGGSPTPTPTVTQTPTPTPTPNSIWNKSQNNPVYSGGTTWGTNLAVNPVVLKVNNEYKMWYVGNNGSKFRIGYASSPNGISNWVTNPTDVVPVGTPDGWEKEVYDPSVIYDNGVYKMWYISANSDLGPSGADRWRIRYATSSDGINWTPTPGWVMYGTAGKWDEGGMNRGMTVLKINGTYHMWYAATNTNDQTVNPYWRIGYATSPDGINWTKQNNVNPVIEPTKPWEGDNVSGPNVIYEGGIFKMWYEKRNGDQPTNQLVFATSTDGINWTKPDSLNPNLTSSSGFDSQLVFTPYVMHDGNEYKMWYAGNDGQVNSIGLATLSAPTITPLSNATINEGDTFSANGSFSDTNSASWSATVNYGDGTGTQPLSLSGMNFSLNHTYTTAGTYSVTVNVTNDKSALGTATGTVTVNVARQLTALVPATMYISRGGGILNTFNIKAEVYKDNTLVTSGTKTGVNPSGLGGNATVSIPFTAFSPVDFPSGSALKIKVSACSTGGLLQGAATLHYNAAAVDSKFGATIGNIATTYHLLSGSVLGTTAGTSAQTVNANATCSTYTSFGTWTVTP